MRASQPHLRYSNVNQIDDSSPNNTLVTPLSATSSQSYYSDERMMRKRRRVDRACDACRRKKTKCDGHKMPKNVCTNCIQSRKVCTYVEESKPRGPSKAYITALENQVEQTEAILKMLRPEFDLDAELGPRIIRDSWKTDDHSKPSAYLPTKIYPDPTGKSRSSPHSVSSPADSSTSSSTRPKNWQSTSEKGKPPDPPPGSDNSEDDSEIVRGLSLLNLSSAESARLSISSAAPPRYSGKSSGFTLLQKAQAIKADYIRETQLAGVADVEGGVVGDDEQPKLPDPARRPEFWEIPQWELHWEGLYDMSLIHRLSAALPPVDLAHTLTELFFKHVNMHFPLLHRPTFERQWQDNLQYHDEWFASLSLSIFAVASRWCDDTRVLPDNASASDETIWRRAGNKYYYAALPIHQVRRTMVTQACLTEIQTHAVMAMYLRGVSDFPLAWLCVSLGLRKAQDLGAHCKKVYIDPYSIAEEQWRRAYWILVGLDRLISAALGRPCCVRDTDCDIDLPTEVDDEYWGFDKPEQPPGRPALVVAFTHFTKLTRNVELALNSILAVDTSKLRIGIPQGPKWKEEVLMRTNVDMAKWIDSLPCHLRWSPDMADQEFSDQAATLYTTYYMMQILIYRPFTPYAPVSMERKKDSIQNLPFPASIICINAAKSCARILDVQMRRGYSNTTNLISTAQICGTLLANVWNLQAKDKVQRPAQLEDLKLQSLALSDAISVFVKALELVAMRWDSAYKYLQQIKNSLHSSVYESVPRQLQVPDPVYPHLPTSFEREIISHGSDRIRPSMSSMPVIYADQPDIHAAVGASDWLPAPETSMYVSASYPPRGHHYPDTSIQPNWSEPSYDGSLSSSYENWHSSSRPLTRTYSTDNFMLPSYRTAPVPVPLMSSTRGMTPARMPHMPPPPPTDLTVPQFDYQQFDYIPKPTPPMDIRRPMHGQTHNEHPVPWNAEGLKWDNHGQWNGAQQSGRNHEQNFVLETGFPQELSYPMSK